MKTALFIITLLLVSCNNPCTWYKVSSTSYKSLSRSVGFPDRVVDECVCVKALSAFQELLEQYQIDAEFESVEGFTVQGEK